jgi:NAD-dependent dihydropyrimidine dehydrogenase PreA subunit
MSVARRDLNACIGCQKCVNRCPMDVFYFDKKTRKSVIAYPENCQSCAQCYLGCPGDSLMMVDIMFEYSPVPARGLRTFTTFMPEKE